jgi:hypothetical protein
MVAAAIRAKEQMRRRILAMYGVKQYRWDSSPAAQNDVLFSVEITPTREKLQNRECNSSHSSGLRFRRIHLLGIQSKLFESLLRALGIEFAVACQL